ncbi:hypothetical protein GOP47_0025040, partial [Adiantum capillus-veneris]
SKPIGYERIKVTKVTALSPKQSTTTWFRAIKLFSNTPQRLVQLMKRAFPSGLCSKTRSSKPLSSQHLQNLSDGLSLDKALDDLLGPSCSSPKPPYTHTPLHESFYIPLLKACLKLKALPQAQRINAHLCHSIPSLSTFLGENLLLTLARCGAISDALALFESLSQRTVFSWTAIISGLSDYGHAYDALRMHECMLEDGLEPDAYTFVSLFKACGTISDLETGRKLHDAARIKGFMSEMIVLTALLSMYAKCGALEEAEDVFCCLCQPDIVSWNALLCAYIDHGEGEKTLLLYLQMHEERMYPSHHTVVIALKACKCAADGGDAEAALEVGRALHSYARKHGIESQIFVQTTLVSMYGKCGNIMEAENVFTEPLQHHLSLWNAMLSAYVEQGHTQKGLQLFGQMLMEGVSPDERTYTVALQACVTCMERDGVKSSTQTLCLQIGEALHYDAEVGNFTSSVYVGTILLSLYGKCGLIAKAERVFDGLSEHTAIAWNALLCAYIDSGQGEKVVDLYKQMQLDHVPLDATLILSVLQACNEIGTLGVCLRLHFDVMTLEHDVDFCLRSALINAYGTCANIADAESVLHGFPHLDVASWNACIAGYAMEGNITASALSFEEIQFAGLIPDGVTYASIISACNHAGLVQNAMEYFVLMGSLHGISPDAKHLVSISDLLGRAGDFRRVNSILQRMSKHTDLNMWLFLLGACRTHGNLELAKQAFEYAVDLEPEQATAYVSMANMYAETAEVEVAAESG